MRPYSDGEERVRAKEIEVVVGRWVKIKANKLLATGVQWKQVGEFGAREACGAVRDCFAKCGGAY